MPSKSKSKGNKNEYLVRDLFTAWYGKPFVKAPNSGALRWNGIMWTYGDLIPPEDFPFVVEAKHYEELSCEEILGRRQRSRPGQPALPPSFGTGKVEEFWYDQVKQDAARATSELGRPIEPLLVYKQDFRRPRICLDALLFQRFPGELRKELICFWVYIPEKTPFMVLDFEFFLEKVSPEALRKSFSELHSSQ
jgi:hypothetical protein